MASELCMNCFSVKGQYEVCPYCGYVEGTPPKQPHYLPPGVILKGRFIVGNVIGAGGFGITYKAFDSVLGVVVAAKEFYPAGLVNRAPGECQIGLLSGEKEGQYADRLNRFLMEAQSVARFGKAKDIVNVFDYFEENGTAYMIMENIEGVLLKDYLDKQGAVDPETAMSIIMPIIEAVKKIHSKGIIHRDISPDNIFITDENEIKVFDFGAAQLNGSKEGMAAEPVIKVGYSPLEQYRDNSRQGFYTDVYAVGAILYQLLTGEKPMESTEREFKDELESPKELGVQLSPNMDRAVMEALSVRQELRFQGMQQFQDALLNKRIAEYPKEKIRKRKRTRNWTISLVLVAGLAVAVGIGLYSTVLKPQNLMFDTPVQAGTEITVWVENEDQKAQIDELAKNGFKKGESSNTADERVSKMQEENESVTVKVECKEDMEEALDKAQEEGTPLPNMFLADHVADLEEYGLVSLKENVYASLNQEDYLFLDEYKRAYSSMEEMPTGIDTLLLYACQFDYHKDNALEDSWFVGNARQQDTVELSELTADGTKDVGKWAVIKGAALAKALPLGNGKWEKVFARNRKPDLDMVNALIGIQEFNSEETKKKYMVNKDQKSKIYGNNIVAGAAFRSKMNQARDQVGEKGANPLSGYRTYVVTQDGKMLVDLSERYAITKESSQDQQIACMRMLWVMLSEIGQSKKQAPGQTTYPILCSAFEEFPSYNAGFGGFVQMVVDYKECVLIGKWGRDAQEFVSGLSGKDAGEIESYCEEGYFMEGK